MFRLISLSFYFALWVFIFNSCIQWNLISLYCEVLWSFICCHDSALSWATTLTVSVLIVWVCLTCFFGTSNCKFSENLCLKTLCAGLTVVEKESSVSTQRTALEAAEALREFTAWGSNMELEAIESEQTCLVLSLPLYFAWAILHGFARGVCLRLFMSKPGGTQDCFLLVRWHFVHSNIWLGRFCARELTLYRLQPILS